MGDQRPVGVFDSGIGGLTVLREIQLQQPAERCVYVADSREAPYGTKPIPFVQERCTRITEYLLGRDAKVIVVACNTASVVALAQLRARFDVPFVGIVPAVKPAATLTSSRKIGVLATPNTAGSEPLAQLIEQFTHGVTVMTQVCPGLVELVERGIVDGPQVEPLLRRYLEPMIAAGVDVVVLGCTHYPFLREPIQRVCGPDIRLLNPADAVARQLGRVLTERALASDGADAATTFATTGDPAEFTRVATQLMGTRPETVEAISI